MADSRTLEIVLKARDDASQVIKSVGSEASTAGEKLASSFKAGGLAAGILLGGMTLATKAAVDQAAAYEQNRVGFETMLGSADKARLMLTNLSAFAARTPFNLPQVVEGAKQLLAYGFSADQIIPTFKTLGDIAAGVGMDKLPFLVMALGQVQAKGHLAGQELLQFTNAGVGLAGQLQKDLGVTRDQFDKLMASGSISSAQVVTSLSEMTGQGGLFFNMMDKQSHSFSGVMSNIQDDFGRFVRQLVGINANGDIRQGSLFYYLKIGAEQLLKQLDVWGPKVSAFMDTLMKNKDAILVFFGILGGIILLAVGAFLVAYASAIAMVAAFALVGAGIALLIGHWGDITGFVQDKWNVVVGIATAGLHGLQRVLTDVSGAFGMYFDLLTGGDPVLRGHGQDLVWLAQKLSAIRDAVETAIDWFRTLPGVISTAVNNVVAAISRLPGEAWSVITNYFMVTLPMSIGFSIGLLMVLVPRLVMIFVDGLRQLPARSGEIWSQVNTITTAWLDQLTQTVQRFIIQLFTNTVAWFARLPGEISTWLIATLNAVGHWLSMLPGVFATWLSASYTTVTGWLSSTGSAAQGQVSSWGGRLSGAIANLPGAIAGVFASAKNAVLGEVNALWSGLVYVWDKIKAVFDQISGAFTRGISLGTSVGKTLHIPGFATGTLSAPGGLAYVHQNELISLPQGSRVYNSRETQQLMGSSNGPMIGTVNVYNNADIDTLAQRLGFAYKTGVRLT